MQICLSNTKAAGKCYTSKGDSLNVVFTDDNHLLRKKILLWRFLCCCFQSPNKFSGSPTLTIGRFQLSVLFWDNFLLPDSSITSVTLSSENLGCGYSSFLPLHLLWKQWCSKMWQWSYPKMNSFLNASEFTSFYPH